MPRPLSFSQRMGITPVKVNIQTDGMTDELRVILWNTMCVTVLFNFSPGNSFNKTSTDGLFLKSVWTDFLKSPIDEFSDSWIGWKNILKPIFFDMKWNRVYDFIQFVLDYHPSNNFIVKQFIPKCNKALEAELSGYRIVGKVLIPITSEQEIIEIEGALKDTSKIKAISLQLEQSLRKLSDRENPDYRGSIKESISAVETLCRIVTHQPKLELGKALKQIESQGKIDLHPALKDAFMKLYGWTSDDNGIRHALMDEPNIEFEDSKFMLVSCSAFINYVLAKLAKAGIEV